MRAIVIGGGIVGASTAYGLSRLDAIDTVLIDQAGTSTGASAASFGWVNASSKMPREYFELNVRGLEEYNRLLKDNVLSGVEHGRGCLIVRESSGDIEDIVDRASSWGYNARLMSVADARNLLVPDAALLDNGSPVGFFPEDIWIDVPGAVRRLIKLASDSGMMSLYGCRVIAIDALSNGEYKVSMEDGSHVVGDVVVNCGGADADSVGRLINSPVTLSPRYGVTMLVDYTGVRVDYIIRTESVDVRPDTAGTLRLHSLNLDSALTGGGDKASVVREFVSRATELLPGIRVGANRGVWVRPRPIPADGFPWVGPVGDTPNYYEIITHSGVTLGPLLGRLIASEIAESIPSDLLGPYRAGRNMSQGPQIGEE